MAYGSADMPSTNEEPNLKQPVDDSQNDIQVMNELCQVMGDEIPVLCCNTIPELVVSVNDPTEPENFALCLCQKCSEYFTSDKELNSHDCNNKFHKNMSLMFDAAIAESEMKENEESIITDCIEDLLKDVPPKDISKKVKPASNTSLKQKKKPKIEEKPKNIDDRPKTTESRRSRNDGGPHDCPMCDKKFSRRTGLSIHIRRHTGETPFECEFCKKKYVVQYDLDRHIMLVHLGTKKYTCFCDVCRKPFVSKSGLLEHKKLFHVEMKLYPCAVCGINFIKQELLDEHMKKHEKKIIIEYYDSKPPNLLIVYKDT